LPVWPARGGAASRAAPVILRNSPARATGAGAAAEYWIIDVPGMSLILHLFDKLPSHRLTARVRNEVEDEMADEALNTGVFRAARYADLSAARTHSRRKIEACAPCSFNDGNSTNRRCEHANKKPGHCGRALLLSKCQIAND